MDTATAPDVMPRPARLDPALPAAEAWADAVRGEVHTALDWLQGGPVRDVATRIHEARRACKRLRALLRLAEPAAPEALREMRRWVAAAARGLAPGRDAQVAADTLDALVSRYAGGLDTGAFAPLQRRLRARVPVEVPERAVLDAVTTLESIVEALAETQAPRPDPDALRSGMVKTWRRARRDARAALADDAAASWHRLRSRVLVLANQAQALCEVTDGALRGRERRLRRLAKDLGRAHDRSVLRARVAAEPVAAPVVPLLDALLAADEQALYRDAAPIAARLFDPSAKRFARRLARHWTSGD